MALLHRDADAGGAGGAGAAAVDVDADVEGHARRFDHAAAARRYRGLGYQVRPIDVSLIYTLNGSLGCLVNVVRRG